jgi:hypothetical protein
MYLALFACISSKKNRNIFLVFCLEGLGYQRRITVTRKKAGSMLTPLLILDD